MPAVLTLLRIKNLALVEELQWLPGRFVAVTGETGAGKSIYHRRAATFAGRTRGFEIPAAPVSYTLAAGDRVSAWLVSD
jgi:type II secretory pathway predicted ATPase ExeA